MMPLHDMTGQVFGKLTVIRLLRINKKPYWLCSCACGNKHTAKRSNLISGNVKSCGCLRAEANIKYKTGKAYHVTHGLSKNAFYVVWLNMKSRCLNPQDVGYKKLRGSRH